MHICIFGDSITWGACDYEKGGWVERLKIYFLEHTDNIEVYNLGVSDDDSNSFQCYGIKGKARRMARWRITFSIMGESQESINLR